MSRRQEAVAICTGERADLRTGTCEKTDCDRERGVRATRLLTELWCAHWNQTETGSSGARGGGWRC